ncbi:hypothetical protein IFM89_001048 [Coptis chinensis]|uniref:Uncharacterized protein n=1 Tax=Coptis chinensis TaxID=261450 RepID=A0A835H945_9MAGN|nr:hypothetical protein IFM89_001048 [Coptis chinensis]
MIDNNSNHEPFTTFIDCALQRATLLKISKGAELESHSKDSCRFRRIQRPENKERRALPLFRPTLWGSMVGPRTRMPGRPWGDLVVPTGVEMMGSAHGFSFLLPHFAQRVEGR